jgi:hypothetical protein
MCYCVKIQHTTRSILLSNWHICLMIEEECSATITLSKAINIAIIYKTPSHRHTHHNDCSNLLLQFYKYRLIEFWDPRNICIATKSRFCAPYEISNRHNHSYQMAAILKLISLVMLPDSEVYHAFNTVA